MHTAREHAVLFRGAGDGSMSELGKQLVYGTGDGVYVGYRVHRVSGADMRCRLVSGQWDEHAVLGRNRDVTR